MRQHGRTDRNQALIVRTLRQMGCSVQSLASVGDGCPDLAVGVNGINILAEIKDGELPPSQKKLTTDEAQWHALWNGTVSIWESLDDAIKAVEAAKKHCICTKQQ